MQPQRTTRSRAPRDLTPLRERWSEPTEHDEVFVELNEGAIWAICNSYMPVRKALRLLLGDVAVCAYAVMDPEGCI